MFISSIPITALAGNEKDIIVLFRYRNAGRRVNQPGFHSGIHDSRGLYKENMLPEVSWMNNGGEFVHMTFDGLSMGTGRLFLTSNMPGDNISTVAFGDFVFYGRKLS